MQEVIEGQPQTNGAGQPPRGIPEQADVLAMPTMGGNFPPKELLTMGNPADENEDWLLRGAPTEDHVINYLSLMSEDQYLEQGHIDTAGIIRTHAIGTVAVGGRPRSEYVQSITAQLKQKALGAFENFFERGRGALSGEPKQ